MAVPQHSGPWSLSRSGEAAVLTLSGDWTLDSEIPAPGTVLDELAGDPPVRLRLIAGELGRWDSALMTFLMALDEACRARGITLDAGGLPEGTRNLLALVHAVPERAGARRDGKRTPWLAEFGRAFLDGCRDLRNLVGFVGEAALGLFALGLGRARFRAVDLWLNIQDCGPSALPIVTLISLLVGLILAFVGAVQLALFGAQIYLADLVSLGMTREMGALMTAIIMAGRTGAAFAAQLGTMHVNSEIAALRVMGIAPMEFLVLPRMLALILVMPLLCLYADLLGILGGGIVAVGIFDVPLVQFVQRAQEAVHLKDFLIGLFKCGVFGLLIALAGCLRGMQCGRSAAAVGEAATSAVVTSIVFIVVADSVITLICNRLGI
jgi:phospholipid/cholesterol/gamma-HCH transport system permease protein